MAAPAPILAGRVDVELRGPLWDGRGGAHLTRLLGFAIEASALRIETKTAELTPVNTGLLRGSLGKRVEVTGAPDAHGIPAQMTGTVGTPVSYGPFVEFGTRPHWPPVAPIEAWVRRKLAADVAQLAAARGGGKNAFEAAVKSIAFMVRRAISLRGTKGSAALRTATAQNREYTVKAVEAAVHRWAADISA